MGKKGTKKRRMMMRKTNSPDYLLISNLLFKNPC